MPLAVGGDTATPINLARRAAIMKQHIARNHFVLDVGCGRGEYLRTLLEETPNAFGIETSPEKLRDCFSAHPELRGHVINVGVEAMPFPKSHFDVVILNEVLEHVSAQDAALSEIRRVLKKDGNLLLFCPNRFFPFETHGFLIRGTLRKWVPALNYLPTRVLGRMGIECVAYN